jgi:hypothetical protein
MHTDRQKIPQSFIQMLQSLNFGLVSDTSSVNPILILSHTFAILSLEINVTISLILHFGSRISVASGGTNTTSFTQSHRMECHDVRSGDLGGQKHQISSFLVPRFVHRWSGTIALRIGSEENLPCKIWGFHGGDYDDYNLLGDDAVWLL